MFSRRIVYTDRTLGVDESRQYPRYAVEVAVEIGANGGTLTGRSSNVSQGGLAGHVNGPVAPGTDVSISLALIFDTDSFSEPLELPARVVWCTALGDVHQIGVSFRVLSDDQQQFLGMFLRYLEEGHAHERAGTDRDEEDPDDPFSA